MDGAFKGSVQANLDPLVFCVETDGEPLTKPLPELQRTGFTHGREIGLRTRRPRAVTVTLQQSKRTSRSRRETMRTGCSAENRCTNTANFLILPFFVICHCLRCLLVFSRLFFVFMVF